MQGHLFWLFLAICALPIPALLVICGAVFCKTGGPKHSSGLCGYRTKLSRRSRESWEFAHRYVGRWWIVIGIATLAGTLALAVMTYSMKNTEELATAGLLEVTVQALLLMVPIWPTERALRKNFDAHGWPITPLGLRLSGATPQPAPQKETAAPAPEPGEKGAADIEKTENGTSK